MVATLQLKSITCLQQQEVFTDELYLTFNGRKISLPNMTQGRTKNLSGDYQFNGSASLSLFEDDGDHWYDRNDYLGSHTISEAQAPGGVFSLDFSLDGHYKFDVDVMSLTFG